MKVLVASTTVLFSHLASLALLAAEPGATSVALFDGKTLDGWTVLGCEAEVQDGAILVKAGNGLLQTKQQYADFVLEVEWKALQKERWDSGIYLRGDFRGDFRGHEPIVDVWVTVCVTMLAENTPILSQYANIGSCPRNP